ncbi:MAG: septal ring lytic transglycosylase RlpA family protein [Pseudomonadota bacterium]
MNKRTLVWVVLLCVGLSGCLSRPVSPPSRSAPPPDVLPPQYERSYVVFGQRYYILKSANGYDEQGIASWYGPKFHGRKTANGETYDMHGMSAAHKSLPLDTWVRVTNLDNQKQLTLRINDRGPFVDDRIIDLSFAAAKALDVVAPGTAPVRVEAISATARLAPREVVTATIERPAVIESRPSLEPAPVFSEEPAADAAPTGIISPDTVYGSTPVMPAPSPATATSSTRERPRVAASDSQVFQSGSFIQVAAFSSLENATAMKTQLEQSGFENVFVQSFDANGRTVHRVRLGPLNSATQHQSLTDKLTAIGLLGFQTVRP